MADEEKASSLLSEEQHDDNLSVEMEFKVADINDEVSPGWRLASISDVESHSELVKVELCGMTLNICSLIDGTIGGPGLGYQITHQTDNTLDHKLLICDPSSLPAEVTVTRTEEDNPGLVNPDIRDNNTIIEHCGSSSVVVTSTSVCSEYSSETILTQEYKISTETNVLQQNSYEILTMQTNDSIQPYISSIQNNIENSGNKVEVSVDSNIERGCEKIECDNIDTVIQPSKVDIDIGENVDDINIEPSSEDICDPSDSDKEKHDAGSENVTEVSKADTSNNSSKSSNASDLEGGKSTESSPGVKKKKVKPMSESMQRLTAKRESPDSKRSTTDLVSAAERKARADEARKQKIIEQRRKDDERRAAVLERRKKLEDAEREKKEALFKKLTTRDNDVSPLKTSPMQKRYSLSTSNLHQLKKTKPVEAKIDLNTTTGSKKSDSKTKDKTKPLDRPRSAMQRPTMGLPPDRSKTDSKKASESRRPMTAFGTRLTSTSAKPPSKPSARPTSSRQSLNTSQPPRPSTALGIPNADKRKSVPPKQPRGSLTEKPPLHTSRTLQKAKSTSGLTTKDKKTGTANAAEKKEPKKTTPSSDKKNMSIGLSPVKKDAAKDKPKTPRSSAPTKEKKEKTSDDKPRDLPPKRSSAKAAPTPNKKELTEEEAKKALAERRKKAKEEAEAKAKAEREKDEEERRKREEEEKRLAEQLKLEEERNAILLEQLKKEEEERRQTLIDEKEQREREERERLEEEQRQREEEIDRKAKLELDRIQKEQEKQEMLLEEERIERKKRVEMIMARVSSKRVNAPEEETATTPVDSASTPSPPEQLSSDPARLKVNDILRSRGFGRSSEDVSTLVDKPGDGVIKSDEVNESLDEQTKSPDEIAISADDVSKNQEIKLLGSIIDTTAVGNNAGIALDESPPAKETQESVSPEEAPGIDVSLEKYLTYNNTSAVTDDTSEYIEPCSDIEFSTNGDPPQSDISSYVNHELSETVDEISLAVSDNGIDQVSNNHASLNDTNNNKDFVNTTEPIVAWNENETISQHESLEKIRNHESEGDNGCSDKLSNEEHDDMPIYMNGNQDGKVINGSGDIHLVAGESLFMKTEDISHETESDQWNKFDERMKQIQPPGEPVPGSDENKLWKVLEGKVELSECF